MAPRKPPKAPTPEGFAKTVVIDGTEYRIREVTGYELTRAMKRPLRTGGAEEDSLVEALHICVEPPMTREEIKALPARAWFQLTDEITKIHGLDFQ